MDTGAKLIQLAKERFGELTVAETKLFGSAANGEVADCSASDDIDNDPTNAEQWPKDRSIRAECVEWLCTNPEASGLVTHKGIQVKSARIDDQVNLEFSKILFPLCFEKSALLQGMNLQQSKISALYLSGTHTGPIKADGIKVEGDVILSDGFKAQGMVGLVGATIEGNLECNQGAFINEGEEKVALNADRLKVHGDVFFVTVHGEKVNR